MASYFHLLILISTGKLWQWFIVCCSFGIATLDVYKCTTDRLMQKWCMIGYCLPWTIRKVDVTAFCLVFCAMFLAIGFTIVSERWS